MTRALNRKPATAEVIITSRIENFIISPVDCVFPSDFFDIRNIEHRKTRGKEDLIRIRQQDLAGRVHDNYS
jgi:hypothetical protein